MLFNTTRLLASGFLFAKHIREHPEQYRCPGFSDDSKGSMDQGQLFHCITNPRSSGRHMIQSYPRGEENRREAKNQNKLKFLAS